MAAALPLRGVSGIARTWRIITYNCQQPGPSYRYRNIFEQIGGSVLSLQSTGIRRQLLGQKHLCDQEMIGPYHVYEWPLETGPWVSTACGVSVGLHHRLFRAQDVRQVWSPPGTLQGRGGALRVRRHGLYDFCFHEPLSSTWTENTANAKGGRRSLYLGRYGT